MLDTRPLPESQRPSRSHPGDSTMASLARGWARASLPQAHQPSRMPSRPTVRRAGGISGSLRRAEVAKTWGAQRLTQSRAGGACVAASSSWASVDVEQGKPMLDRQGYTFLDLRSEREFDAERLTKPPRCSVNAPIAVVDASGSDVLNPAFISSLAEKVAPSTKLLVASRDGGEWSTAAMELLLANGYVNAVEVQGGYSAWTKVFSTSGRRKPPAGRWVSTGTEALKSGLNVGDAALSYDEGGNLTEARWAGEKKQQ